MDWKHYAEHKCGHIERVSFGEKRFLTDLGRLCSRCGEPWRDGEFKMFVGREVWDGKWYNPLTWFKFKVIRKGI